jgi:hypothetical protein
MKGCGGMELGFRGHGMLMLYGNAAASSVEAALAAVSRLEAQLAALGSNTGRFRRLAALSVERSVVNICLGALLADVDAVEPALWRVGVHGPIAR